MWIVSGIVFCFLGFTHCLPAPVPSLQYELGTTYKYSCDFTILLNEDSNLTSRVASVGRNVGYKVSSEFLLSPVWQDSNEKLVKIELLKPTLHVSSTMHQTENINRHWSKLDNLSYPPMYVHWQDGSVKKVYVLPDSLDMTNIKKGIASLMQVRTKDFEGDEPDVAGLCSVRYKVHGSTIKKTKTSCKREYFYHNNFSSHKLFTPSVSSTSEMIYHVNSHEGLIESISGREEVRMILNLWKQAAVFVKSKFSVKFSKKYTGHKTYSEKHAGAVLTTIAQELGSKLRGEPLEAVSEKGACPHCKTFPQLIQEVGANLQHEYLGELKSAGAFLKFVDTFRIASKKELLILFKDADPLILPQLLDVLAAARTPDAIEVSFQLLDFEANDVTIQERFLLCLAAAPNPDEALISATMKQLNRKISNPKLRTTLLLTLASLVKTYHRSNPENIKSPIVSAVTDLFLSGLSTCAPNDDPCASTYLLALSNAALAPSARALANTATQRGGPLGLAALQALAALDPKEFDQEIQLSLWRVYHGFWPNQESGSRVLAAELLLIGWPHQTLKPIIASLAERGQSEVSTLVLDKIKGLAKTNTVIRSCLKDLMRNVTFVNYNTLAQNGSSASIIRDLQATHDVNVTYGIDLEMRPSGMLKRTKFDLNVMNGQEKAHILSLSLFVEGFGLSEEEQKERKEEHSAGMRMSVLGVHLRPYTFFTGTGELMGLVWSGAGNSPTPALQSNFLFMDERHSSVLQSGIVVDFDLKGALSADISGSVEVSMWNKNAHARVNNKGAMLVTGACRVDTSFVESHVDFAMGGHSTLDMSVDLDFADKPMRICLQAEQPEYVFRHNVRKTERIPGSKQMVKTLKRRSISFPGRSLSLFAKNRATCRAMLAPKKEKASFW